MKAILLAIVVVLAIIGIFVMAAQKSSQPSLVTTQLTTIPSPTQNTPPTQALIEEATPTPLVQASPSAVPQFQKAILTTSKGKIEIQLFPNEAPGTVTNFAQKAQSNFYKNLTFHRVEDWVVQGGDPAGNGTGGGKMPTELNDRPFVLGSVGVARGQDIKVSNDAQFFITTQEASWLNKQYTNFGIVTKGMDIVEKIQVGDKILSITVQ